MGRKNKDIERYRWRDRGSDKGEMEINLRIGDRRNEEREREMSERFREG